MWCVDFETHAIEGNTSLRPPVPVGFSLKRPGYKGRYFRWGHPSGNNCSFQEAQAKLASVYDAREPLVFYNAKFDLCVAERHMGLKIPAWFRIHDVMFMVFLEDPYAESLGLKQSAERILAVPPDEQTALRNWVLSHVPGATESNWGAYIAHAPGDLVEPYANGDTARTLQLFSYLENRIPQAAYDRERKLLPILIRSEQRGVRLDQERLEHDMSMLEGSLLTCEDRVRALLGDDNVNLDSGQELADAVDRAGLAGEWQKTPTGKRSVSRDNLIKAIASPELLRLLVYRGATAHCLANFGRPWIELGRSYNGRLHPDWSQVRQPRAVGSNSKGTRTGRLSGMKPNFMNMPNEYDLEIPQGLEPLPLMRQYLLPDKGYVWLKRDYSQQELRILAHFSEGRLYERYLENPRIDAHEETGSLIKEYTGHEFSRKYVKITGFSIIYGAGLGRLADQLGAPISEASLVRESYFKALPEIKPLMRECSAVGRRGDCITTWGGRSYFVEPPKLVRGRMMDYSYKLLNYLIQGSAADCTKESIIRWMDDPGPGEFLVTVHDENNGQAPKEDRHLAMGYMRRAMESIEFDVKMLSDGYYGKNWADLKPME